MAQILHGFMQARIQSAGTAKKPIDQVVPSSTPLLYSSHRLQFMAQLQLSMEFDGSRNLSVVAAFWMINIVAQEGLGRNQ